MRGCYGVYETGFDGPHAFFSVFRPGTVALREIRKYQKSTELVSWDEKSKKEENAMGKKEI